MIELKLNEKQGRYVAAGMAVLVGLMAISLIYQGAMHLVWRSWLKEASAVLVVPTTQPASSQPTTQPASGPAKAEGKKGRDKELAPPKVAAAISRRNVFVSPRPTGHGLTLTGVIGRIALFNAQDGGTLGIQEGESDRDVKVVSIQNYEVTIEFKGKRETLKVFDGGGGEGPSPGPGPEMQAAGGPPGPGAARFPAGAAPVSVNASEIQEKLRSAGGRRAALKAMRVKQVEQSEGGGQSQTGPAE